MHRARLLLALGCLAMAQAPACTPAPANVQVATMGVPILSQTVSERVSRGVFEVVVPVVKDTPGTRYAIPLPVDLLPFAARNDGFSSIATAFAISPTRFVTAAHVIPLRGRLDDSYFLHDAAGRTYPIGRITRYSQYRDLVEFELASAVPDVVPLVTRNDIGVGEAVFTVGNAYGSGVVVRGGALVSFSPEPTAGAWKHLVFTSPASPGNSGGPLVDNQGRVVGVVVLASPAQNLNLAVPIGELDATSTARCDASMRGFGLDEDRQKMLVDWAFSAPLPDTIPSLHAAAKRSFDSFLEAKMAEFDARFAQDTFPNAPRIRPLLRHPMVGSGFGGFTVDGTGAWQLAWSKYTSKEISPGWFAQLGDSADGMSGEMLLSHPSGMPLARFFETPRLLVEALLRSHSWDILFAGQRIRIEGLGEPSRSERWNDRYGRPWFTFAWPIARARQVLMVHCLTNAAGWGCVWRKLPEGDDDVGLIRMKRQARRLLFSYYGFVDDWRELSALPVAYKPRLLASAMAFVQSDSSLAFTLPPFAGGLATKSLSGRSLLDAFVAPLPNDPATLGVVGLALRPIPTMKSLALSLTRVLDPLHETPSMDQTWQKIRSSATPYDDVERVDGEARTIQAVGPRGSADAEDARLLVTCSSRTRDTDIDLRAMCSSFEAAARFLPTGVH